MVFDVRFESRPSLFVELKVDVWGHAGAPWKMRASTAEMPNPTYHANVMYVCPTMHLLLLSYLASSSPHVLHPVYASLTHMLVSENSAVVHAQLSHKVSPSTTLTLENLGTNPT